MRRRLLDIAAKHVNRNPGFVEDVRFFHGGHPGLGEGDKVLPPSVTGAAGTDTLHEYGSVGSKDRVYITTSEAVARMHAAGHPSGLGVVYEVEPDGDIRDDPDCQEAGVSYSCKSATVVRVIKLSSSARKRAIRAAARELGQFNMRIR